MIMLLKKGNDICLDVELDVLNVVGTCCVGIVER